MRGPIWGLSLLNVQRKKERKKKPTSIAWRHYFTALDRVRVSLIQNHNYKTLDIYNSWWGCQKRDTRKSQWERAGITNQVLHAFIAFKHGSHKHGTKMEHVSTTETTDDYFFKSHVGPRTLRSLVLEREIVLNNFLLCEWSSCYAANKQRELWAMSPEVTFEKKTRVWEILCLKSLLQSTGVWPHGLSKSSSVSIQRIIHTKLF